MGTELRQTVTVSVRVDPRIADLVYFVKRLEAAGVIKYVGTVSDDQLVAQASSYWDTAHGEDD